MHEHLREFRLAAMCRVLGVHRSGFYAWQRAPKCERAWDDERIVGLIKQSWLESGTVYGYRKVCADLRDLGERCSRHRVARLMRGEALQAQRVMADGLIRKVGGRRPWRRTGSTSTSTCPHRTRIG